jgi:hypothetical protein
MKEFSHCIKQCHSYCNIDRICEIITSLSTCSWCVTDLDTLFCRDNIWRRSCCAHGYAGDVSSWSSNESGCGKVITMHLRDIFKSYQSNHVSSSTVQQSHMTSLRSLRYFYQINYPGTKTDIFGKLNTERRIGHGFLRKGRGTDSDCAKIPLVTT